MQHILSMQIKFCILHKKQLKTFTKSTKSESSAAKDWILDLAWKDENALINNNLSFYKARFYIGTLSTFRTSNLSLNPYVSYEYYSTLPF